jgi:phosphate-selective porin
LEGFFKRRYGSLGVFALSLFPFFPRLNFIGLFSRREQVPDGDFLYLKSREKMICYVDNRARSLKDAHLFPEHQHDPMKKAVLMLQKIRFAASAILMLISILAPVIAFTEEKKFPTKLQISGYFQTDYYVADSGDAPNVPEASFFIRRARLSMNGDLSEMIDYRFVGSLDGTDANSPTGAAQLIEAWANFKFHPFFKVKVGEFKYTFDREGRESSANLPFVMRPTVVNGLVNSLGRTGGIFRDIGIEFNGGMKNPIGWSYFLGLINGNGLNGRDDNNHKDLYFRLVAEPFRHLNLGAGHYWGKAQVGTPATGRNEKIWTVDGAYVLGPVAVAAAYYEADYDQAGGVNMKPKGWYALASYKVLENLDLLVRRQEYNQDGNAQDKVQASTDFGANFYLARKGMWSGAKIAVNYMFRHAQSGASSAIWEERGATVTGSNVKDLFAARLQIPF